MSSKTWSIWYATRDKGTTRFPWTVTREEFGEGVTGTLSKKTIVRDTLDRPVRFKTEAAADARAAILLTDNRIDR